MTRHLILIALALALPLAATALTNQDIVKMQKAGLAEDTILLSIQNEPANFDTSADALIELKKSGVSEKVIQRLIARQTGGSTAPDATEPPPSPVFMQDFPSIAPPYVVPAVGQNYFTRYTFHEEDDEHVTTNYARGEAVPINTPVTLLSFFGAKLTLKRADTGQLITIKNEEKYSRKSIAEIARLLLSSEKTPLERLPEPVATAIRAGELHKGMSKELVLMTRGYPPAHETSIDGDRWVYWSSRFVKLTIVFSNGHLSEGRGLN